MSVTSTLPVSDIDEAVRFYEVAGIDIERHDDEGADVAATPRPSGSAAAQPQATARAFMHPDDLADLGVDDGDHVEVTSARGSIRAIVERDPALRRGLVSMAHCYGSLPGEDCPVEDVGSNTNKLVVDDVGTERDSGMPRMGNIPVDIRPV